jgi:hypothetical protein
MKMRVLLFALLFACETPTPPADTSAVFAPGIRTGHLRGADMREASGLVASERFPGSYWTHNDSGDGPNVFLVDSTGLARMRVVLDGVTNRDFEDIARLGRDIHVADIGDNRAVRSDIAIITFEEPPLAQDTVLTPSAIYRMTYPDGARDAETLLVDPLTRDWFIVTKREDSVRVYRYAHPQDASRTVVLERMPGALPFTRVVAGDVSADGGEVLLKTYDQVLYWTRQGDEPLSVTLFRTPLRLPYEPEPQGEAIAFARSGSGYLTVTERGGTDPQWILFYRRK